MALFINNFMKYREIIEAKAMTITAATSHNNIDRAKADKILDPKGYFAKNKKKLRKSK